VSGGVKEVVPRTPHQRKSHLSSAPMRLASQRRPVTQGVDYIMDNFPIIKRKDIAAHEPSV